MEMVVKYICGLLSGILAFFTPIVPLIVCAVVFVAIDFVTGMMASRKRAVDAGEEWGVESRKAWKTINKLCFIMAGIVLAWLIDSYILSFMTLRLANLFTGFVCGVEFWSYLENAAEISGHPLFRSLKRYMKKHIDKAIDNDEEETE